MKKILIYDVAAINGGGLAVLNLYYLKAISDTSNFYYIYTSGDFFKDAENVKIIILKWVKRSWLHRLYCDKRFIQREIRKYCIDEIVSLQNIGVKCECRQTIYVQNVIPFVNTRFPLFSSPYLWIQKNIIGKMARKSLKYGDQIIVQTNWMRNQISNYVPETRGKIIVEQPSSVLNPSIKYSPSASNYFFYPASAVNFKDHMTILKAFRLLDPKVKYTIFFTLSGNENKYSKSLYKYARKYGIHVAWLGQINKEKMGEFYASSTLIFASRLESFGLPLLEAKMIGSPIIASKTPWAEEILDDYQNKSFFDCGDYVALSRLLFA